MLDVTPMLFVVDDDVSVRESLKSLIRCKGWQPETFASAQEFLDYSRRFSSSSRNGIVGDLVLKPGG